MADEAMIVGRDSGRFRSARSEAKHKVGPVILRAPPARVYPQIAVRFGSARLKGNNFPGLTIDGALTRSRQNEICVNLCNLRIFNLLERTTSHGVPSVRAFLCSNNPRLRWATTAAARSLGHG
jgi:hypothetical protein